jgi:hypothetical protein
MNRYILLAIPALALSVAGVVHVSQADAQTAPQAGDKTASLQGPQGAFADKTVMMPFYEILLEAHKQGDKADLAAMETKIKAMLPAGFNGGKPVSKAMEDHVLGVAHQALALGVSNPKMFESYKTFMTTMTGPQ